jgi:hypothetical protein
MRRFVAFAIAVLVLWGSRPGVHAAIVAQLSVVHVMYPVAVVAGADPNLVHVESRNANMISFVEAVTKQLVATIQRPKDGTRGSQNSNPA